MNKLLARKLMILEPDVLDHEFFFKKQEDLYLEKWKDISSSCPDLLDIFSFEYVMFGDNRVDVNFSARSLFAIRCPLCKKFPVMKKNNKNDFTIICSSELYGNKKCSFSKTLNQTLYNKLMDFLNFKKRPRFSTKITIDKDFHINYRCKIPHYVTERSQLAFKLSSFSKDEKVIKLSKHKRRMDGNQELVDYLLYGKY